MIESDSGNTQEIKESLQFSKSVILPNGNIIYSSSEIGRSPLIMSNKGQILVKKNPWLLQQVVNNPQEDEGNKEYNHRGSTSHVSKTETTDNEERDSVAVKKIFDPNKGTGLDQFRALQELQQTGVPVATPLIATSYYLVTKWIEGDSVSSSYKQTGEHVIPYIRRLNQIINSLKRNGNWKLSWYLDTCMDNYIPYNLSAEDPIQRFIALDPMIKDRFGQHIIHWKQV